MADVQPGLSAADLVAGLSVGTMTAAEAAEGCLERVLADEPVVQAFAHLDPEQVRMQALTLDIHLQAGHAPGPLHGLPVALKDIIDTADMPTENGVLADSGRQPDLDAALVGMLRAAGAVIMGKTVTCELAHRKPGKTTNPHDRARTPGGSSSGSAAAVAAGMAPLAVGTQTGGSVIRPAAYCGIVGFKPSIGLIPSEGVFRRSHTLDTMGVFARSVEDAALLADVLAPGNGLRLDGPGAGAGTYRVAMARQPGWEKADADMKSAFSAVGAVLGDLATPIELPSPFESGADWHRTISLKELSDYASVYLPDRADGLSTGMIEDIEIGSAIADADYRAALAGREAMIAALGPIFGSYDVLATPAAPGQAPVGLDYTGDAVFCSLWTLCGVPAITLPLLRGADGMPMGLQLVGPPGGDAALLRIAASLHQRLAAAL